MEVLPRSWENLRTRWLDEERARIRVLGFLGFGEERERVRVRVLRVGGGRRMRQAGMGARV